MKKTELKANKVLSIKLSKNLYEGLKIIADKRGASVQEIIRMYLFDKMTEFFEKDKNDKQLS